MTFPVKEFHSGLPGAPVLADTTNSLIDLLHACLVTGYNLLPCAITVVGGVATVDVGPSQHALDEHMVSLIEGASPSALNGEKRVLAKIDATRYTYAAPGVPDGAAAGTISQRVAPAGWERPYHDSGAGLAVFRSLDPEASGYFFQVLDIARTFSTTRVARVRAYSAMTAVDAGALEAEGEQFRAVQSMGAVKWVLVASARTVYLFFATATSGGFVNSLFPYVGFGDFNSYAPADAHRAFVAVSVTGSSVWNPRLMAIYGTQAHRYARDYLGTTSGREGSAADLGLSYSGSLGASPVDGSVPYHFPRHLTESIGGAQALRGEAPGIGVCYTNRGGVIGDSAPKVSGTWERVAGVQINGTSRNVLHLGAASSSSTAVRGCVIDVTGPWH